MQTQKLQSARQIAHWTMAAAGLEKFNDMAAPEAWDSLEQYLGLSIRQRLQEAVSNLLIKGTRLKSELQLAESATQLNDLHRHILTFRQKYLRVETIIDYYADAVNTRTNPKIAALLRACDILSHRSMAVLLDQLAKVTPPVLTYLDKGLGASILKAGLRLWDGNTLSPVASIKIVRHNLLRPTSLIHEAGHQAAAILNWNEELAARLNQHIENSSSHSVAEIWSSWASEIAADAFAFIHTGYAAVAALHDVLAGEDRFVFRLNVGDPHPIAYLRVLLGIVMCRRFFGNGPWDDLATAWKLTYPIQRAPADIRNILEKSLPLLEPVVQLIFEDAYAAFGDQSIIRYINPDKVKPAALETLQREAGKSLFISHHWIWKEALRLMALSGWQAATHPEQLHKVLRQQEEWMSTLGMLSNRQ